MKRALSSCVATLCLMTLFLSSAACLALPRFNPAVASDHHTAGTTDHACCPQRSPAHEHAPTTCCTVHHQPVSVAVGIELEQPCVISQPLPLISIPAADAAAPSGNKELQTTQPPPLIALRI